MSLKRTQPMVPCLYTYPINNSSNHKKRVWSIVRKKKQNKDGAPFTNIYNIQHFEFIHRYISVTIINNTNKIKHQWPITLTYNNKIPTFLEYNYQLQRILTHKYKTKQNKKKAASNPLWSKKIVKQWQWQWQWQWQMQSNKTFHRHAYTLLHSRHVCNVKPKTSN